MSGIIRMSGIIQMKKLNKKILIWIIIIAAIAVGMLSYALFSLMSVIDQYSDGAGIYSNLEKFGPQEIDESDLSSFDVDFGSLRQINPDIVAWIVLPDTAINYPVVQAKDNEKYLSLTFENTENKAGAIFLDFVNLPDFSDFNSIIYGHNMKDGSMFHDLEKLKDADYFRAHNSGFLITPEKVFKFEIFAVNVLESEDEYRTIGFDSKEDYLDFVERYKSSSMIKTTVETDVKDKILTLSTCDEVDNISDARLAVMAKLIPMQK